MLEGVRINIYGVYETFYYDLSIYKNNEMYIYCEDRGIGAFIIVDEWISKDDSIYRVYSYIDGDTKNDFSDVVRRDCYGDILIIKYSPVMTRPISVNEDEVKDYLNELFNLYKENNYNDI